MRVTGRSGGVAVSRCRGVALHHTTRLVRTSARDNNAHASVLLAPSFVVQGEWPNHAPLNVLGIYDKTKKTCSVVYQILEFYSFFLELFIILVLGLDRHRDKICRLRMRHDRIDADNFLIRFIEKRDVCAINFSVLVFRSHIVCSVPSAITDSSFRQSCFSLQRHPRLEPRSLPQLLVPTKVILNAQVTISFSFCTQSTLFASYRVTDPIASRQMES